MEKLRVADDIRTFVKDPIPMTDLRLTFQTVVGKYSSASEEWRKVITRMDKLNDHTIKDMPTTATMDDISKWLGDLDLDSDEKGGSNDRCFNPKLMPSKTNTGLYRCAYCGNPSAALKKCSGCGKPRYCDKSCQKSHWKDHRNQCKTPV